MLNDLFSHVISRRCRIIDALLLDASLQEVETTSAGWRTYTYTNLEVWWDLLWDLLNRVVDQKHEARTAQLECCCFVVFLCDRHIKMMLFLLHGRLIN
jgi:hypothetical protein